MRRSVLLPVIGGALLVSSATSAVAAPHVHIVRLSSLAPNQVGLTFVMPTGAPVSNAAVRLYLLPWNSPIRFVPPQISSGTTDAGGAFVATIASQKVRSMMNATGGLSPTYDAMAEIATPSAVSAYFFVLPLGKAASAKALLHPKWVAHSMAPDVVTKVGEILAGPLCSGCQADKIEWPSVFLANSSGGTETDYTYTDLTSSTHEFSATAAVSGTSPASGFSAQGMKSEVNARTASEGPIQQNGGFHHHIIGKYTFREYAVCSRTCYQWYWAPLQWDGAIQTGTASSTPAVNHADNFVGPYTRGYTHDTTQGWTFGANFSILSVSIQSVAQYAYSTSEHWSKHGTCGNTHLVIYGNSDYWNTAGAVYTNCYD